MPLVVAPALASTRLVVRTSPAPEILSVPLPPLSAPTAMSPTCTSMSPPETLIVPLPVPPVPASRSPEPVLRTRPPVTLSVPTPPELPTVAATAGASVPELRS